MDNPFYEESCAWGKSEGAPVFEDPGKDCPALVREHALHPRNFGEMSPGLADGYALLCDRGCDDRLELWIMVEDGRIFDIRFKTNGCPETIAACSMATELASGKTVEEAKKITDAEIAKAFGTMPSGHTGCPLAGTGALQAAIADYENKKEEKT